MPTTGKNAVQEQVFDRRGTYLGKVARATLDEQGISIAGYEIDLDEEAAEEIFGQPVESLEVDPMELEVREVLRLTSTISELRDRHVPD